jgi:hypothetical protein
MTWDLRCFVPGSITYANISDSIVEQPYDRTHEAFPTPQQPQGLADYLQCRVLCRRTAIQVSGTLPDHECVADVTVLKECLHSEKCTEN